LFNTIETDTSTPTQWAEKGREYFSHGLYKLAMACFKHAKHETEAEIASAYHRMSRAKLEFSRCETEASRGLLMKAVDMLKKCANESTGQSSSHLWYHVGNCLELAGQLVPASDAFVQGGFHAQAVHLLFDNDNYNNGVALLQSHWDILEPLDRDSLLDQSRQHYLQICDYRSATIN
jgi:tetratricopeptide (TPR) repeat protein